MESFLGLLVRRRLYEIFYCLQLPDLRTFACQFILMRISIFQGFEPAPVLQVLLVVSCCIFIIWGVWFQQMLFLLNRRKLSWYFGWVLNWVEWIFTRRDIQRFLAENDAPVCFQLGLIELYKFSCLSSIRRGIVYLRSNGPSGFIAARLCVKYRSLKNNFRGVQDGLIQSL